MISPPPSDPWNRFQRVSREASAEAWRLCDHGADGRVAQPNAPPMRLSAKHNNTIQRYTAQPQHDMGAVWSRIGAGDYPDTDEWVRGKVCIVTGSNSGLGYYTALYLARYPQSTPSIIHHHLTWISVFSYTEWERTSYWVQYKLLHLFFLFFIFIFSHRSLW
jgi:hypothetical protein